MSALALILWPVIMGPKLDQSIVIESDIPAMPEMPAGTITRPEPRTDVSPVGEYQRKLEQREREQEVAPAATQPATGLDDDGLPLSWIVQVGSFSDRAKADKLSDQLRKKGLRAQVKAHITDKGTFSRVFIGPYVDKAVAETTVKRVQRETGDKPILVRYKP